MALAKIVRQTSTPPMRRISDIGCGGLTHNYHHHGRYPSGRSCCRCRRHGHVTAASVGVAVRHAGLEQGKARMSVMGRLRPKQEKGSEAQQQSRSGTRRTGVPLIVGGGRLAGGWRRLGAEKVGRRASVEEPLTRTQLSPSRGAPHHAQAAAVPIVGLTRAAVTSFCVCWSTTEEGITCLGRQKQA